MNDQLPLVYVWMVDYSIIDVMMVDYRPWIDGWMVDYHGLMDGWWITMDLCVDV